MSSSTRRNCTLCGGHDSEVGPISWRGKCHNCGKERLTTAITELAEHRGPTFAYWRTRIAASVGATIPDTSR
jgi:hypothetical protein